jgi:CCR4-NOT transcription complex subunit 9
MFSHQNFSHGEPAWLNQQHAHQQQTHHQAQAAAAAHASAAHYNRIQATHNAVVPAHLAGHAQEGMMDGVTEENRRVLVWIAELLNEDTRESALLELSKKREQVPELALILWHSFGMSMSHICRFL